MQALELEVEFSHLLGPLDHSAGAFLKLFLSGSCLPRTATHLGLSVEEIMALYLLELPK